MLPASDELDSAVERRDTEAITRVLSALAHEQWPDDDRRGVLHRQTDEFSTRLKAHDRMKQIDRRQREQERAAGAIAFNRYKLPPLTPFEKFQALKSRGQRDGFRLSAITAAVRHRRHCCTRSGAVRLVGIDAGPTICDPPLNFSCYNYSVSAAEIHPILGSKYLAAYRPDRHETSQSNCAS
jgi:hypothetical protein